MKLIAFECDLIKIQNNQAKLSDTIRQAIFGEDESLFDFIEFTNDRNFLEPSIFYQTFLKRK